MACPLSCRSLPSAPTSATLISRSVDEFPEGELSMIGTPTLLPAPSSIVDVKLDSPVSVLLLVVFAVFSVPLTAASTVVTGQPPSLCSMHSHVVTLKASLHAAMIVSIPQRSSSDWRRRLCERTQRRGSMNEKSRGGSPELAVPSLSLITGEIPLSASQGCSFDTPQYTPLHSPLVRPKLVVWKLLFCLSRGWRCPLTTQEPGAAVLTSFLGLTWNQIRCDRVIPSSYDTKNRMIAITGKPSPTTATQTADQIQHEQKQACHRKNKN